MNDVKHTCVLLKSKEDVFREASFLLFLLRIHGQDFVHVDPLEYSA